MCLGLGNGYVPKEEKKVSLLKPYTNNDKINDMSVEEKAKFINSIYLGEVNIVNGCLSERCKSEQCVDCIKQWLESEAE